MKRLVYLSSTAVPHQIKLCHALQKYFATEFWFYESPDRTRGQWWRIDMGDRCKLLKNVFFFKSGPLHGKYLAIGLARKLQAYNPDIVMLGGFSIPSNILAYRWARNHGKRTIVFTERSRDANGALRSRGVAWRCLQWLYRDVDMVMTSAEDAVEQFRDRFGFGERVVAGRYAADLEPYFTHPLRRPKPAYTYLFANRMTEIYNPLGALEIFARVAARHPGSRLLMNAAGELGARCKARVSELKIGGSVEFLTDIRAWDELHAAYARSDILILPAAFSNGNFTILEAMASGMGLVVSDRVLGIGKMVDDGVNGFRCAPTTAEFVGRIERYIHAPRLFNRHALLNRSRIRSLSADGTAEYFAGVLQERLPL